MILKVCRMDLHTFGAIIVGYKKDRYLIVDDKVIIAALIVLDEEESFILDFRTLLW